MQPAFVAALVAAVCVTTAVAGPWRAQSHPQTSGQDAVFNGVVAFSHRDVWAVGYRWGTVGGALEFRTLTYHWDGTSWRQSSSLDVESAPSTTFFEGIDGVPDGPLFAVGWFRRPREPARTMIQRWDGATWSMVPSPNPSPTGNYLEAVAVASASDAWAVGSSHDRSVDGIGLIMHWDGLAWSPVAMPALDFCLKWTYLTGVDMRPSGRALVTGYCLRPDGEYQAFVLRWQGRGWRLVVGPDQLPGSTILDDVTFVDGSEAWAVGTRILGGTSEPLLMHLKDGAWTEVEPPADSRVFGLASVAAAGPDLVWAVGHGDSSQPPFAGVGTLGWDGVEWKSVPAGDFGSLRGVDVTRGGYTFAAGLRVDDSLIMRRFDRRP